MTNIEYTIDIPSMDYFILKYWEKDNCEYKTKIIELEDFIEWNIIKEKAIKQMKENFSKETIFEEVEEE